MSLLFPGAIDTQGCLWARLKALGCNFLTAPRTRSVGWKRFLQRIDEPGKNWKFGLADVEERKFWKQYMSAYEECLNATSTREAPWHVVPADDKENARLIVSQIVLDTLQELQMPYPKTSAIRQRELQLIRKQLEK